MVLFLPFQMHLGQDLRIDLLSIVLVVATQAKEQCHSTKKMFESRLFFVDKLIDMALKLFCVILTELQLLVLITNIHYVTNMTSTDIRAGNALLIAALSAEGKSIIHNIEQIDRGYENIDGRLKLSGADIERIQLKKNATFYGLRFFHKLFWLTISLHFVGNLQQKLCFLLCLCSFLPICQSFFPSQN